MSDDPIRPRPTDNAFLGDLRGGSAEPTYSGALSFMRRRFSRDIDGADAVVWGIPFDCATSNRPGTRFGPQAIRRASAIFDGDPQFPSGLDPFDALTVVDWGDCSFDYRHIEQAPGLIEAQAGEILASGVQLITLGGDHSITLPLLRAHVALHGPLALVQFDAHQDTWEADGGMSHGTFVTQAEAEGLIDTGSSIQIGVRTLAPDDFGIEIIDAYEARVLGAAGIAERVRERVGALPAYLSFDIDALDPAFAPGTGTPVSGGLAAVDALMVLWALRGLDWRGMDVVEVSPPYDHADITAIAGATVVQHYLQILAEKVR
ncbi:agmatinase [Pseudochelatococcus lubricantis]|uniref:Agmatinase n=1 Tax=Pseudochelatococcus lubricantis TaxID=1538102 RepID=A0ABX0UZU1_9HYPH|nr:agmatinase [Pseudochelatococcus lubricantis]NIJ58447.1 agmatinase [Pseudochelatococcus lubricantis]